MKSRFIAIFIFIISTFLMAFQCEDDSNPTMEEEQAELTFYKQTIEDLAAASICDENTECKFIAFGSKPCGGPWSFLIYSTSIDTDQLETLVKEYNIRQENFNKKWGIFSDCSVALPPTSIKCENNTCVPVY